MTAGKSGNGRIIFQNWQTQARGRLALAARRALGTHTHMTHGYNGQRIPVIRFECQTACRSIKWIIFCDVRAKPSRNEPLGQKSAIRFHYHFRPQKPSASIHSMSSAFNWSTAFWSASGSTLTHPLYQSKFAIASSKLMPFRSWVPLAVHQLECCKYIWCEDYEKIRDE